MYRKLVARAILTIALVLIVLNTATYAEIFSDHIYTPLDVSTCLNLYNEINSDASYEYGGKSISDNRVDTWYYLTGCRNREVYVRILEPRNMSRHALILIPDYGSDQSALIGLALRLVSEGYIVVQVNLPSKGILIKLLGENPRETWVYESVCNTMKVITLLLKEIKVSDIGLIGVGFGGNVALLTALYDERVDYVISISGLGDYDYSVSKASIINYYIESTRDLNPCLDPAKFLSHIEKPTLIMMGVYDEINPLDPSLINALKDKPYIVFSLIPNQGRYYIPSEWERVLLNFLKTVSINNSDELINPNISIESSGFEVVVKTNNYSDTMVLARPAIPGFSWSLNHLKTRQTRFTYIIIPGEYIIVDKTYFRAYGVYMTTESYGLVLGLILILVWIILDRDTVVKARNLSFRETMYLITLVLILWYPIYPGIWGIDRFHVSLNDVAEIYAAFFPLIKLLILLSYYALPFLLIIMLSSHGRIAYTIYLSLPLFTTIFTWSFLLFISSRFQYMVPVLPTLPLIVIIAAFITEYILTKE